MGEYETFNPKTAEDVKTPAAFPRNNWVYWQAFGMPPYRAREWRSEAAWAASEASMAWSRALGVPEELNLDGSEPSDLEDVASTADPKDELFMPSRLDDEIDDTVFMLAIFDKAHEM